MTEILRLSSRRSARRGPVLRRRWRWGFGLFFLLWLLLGALFGAPLVARRVGTEEGLPWLEAGVFVGWGLLLPLIVWAMLRERELANSRLAGQLAQANLQMLKMQLHPHFLFNTLNAISALMHRDVDAADRMISRLSDLLRRALDQDDRPRSRLASELDFLHQYLAIEQIRFRDRLQVEVDVEPVCLAALVPRLILQPLVENAIRHGIAMRSASGRLRISARQRDARLILTVRDDGPGLPAGREPRLGVGLGNTRARLSELYGEDFIFELANVEGGFEVRIEIPFERREGR